MMINISKIKNKGIVSFLSLLIVTIGFLAYQNSTDYNSLKEAFELEKKELESELNSVIENYKETSYKKNDISLKLRTELHKIIKLKDTIHNLKTTDYGLINFYRKRIKNLVKQNEVLFSRIDSLNIVNRKLISKSDSVVQVLISKENQNIKLKSKNQSLNREKKGLKQKIAAAEIINISKVKITAMKKKKSGRYTSTSRSSKTDAFKVELILLENKIATPGIKQICIQILDHNKSTLSSFKKIKLKNKNTITCSDISTIDYYNKKLPFVSFIKVNREKMHKGLYTINTFVNGVFSKSTLIKLR